MKVKLYASLRPLVGGHSSVEVETGPGDTFRDLVDALLRRWPALRDELLQDGDISPRIHIFLNGREIRYMDGLDMVIPEDADLRIFPPVGGGEHFYAAGIPLVRVRLTPRTTHPGIERREM